MGELNFALPEGFPIVYRDEASPERFDDAAWGRVFNERRDRRRRPWAVVGATNPADVKVAVDLANSENRRVSVRSGGHSWAGWSVRDEAILIDFGNHNELSYDETTKIATCSTSTTGRILNDFLKDKGRMFAGGHCPDVGLGGFLLQGGMGWNCKNWGWSSGYIDSIEVVTADGREITCSEKENADLFWAARGSGPGFPAVITRFHLNTKPLLSMFESLYFYPKSEARKVLKWVADLCPTADPSIEIVSVAVWPEEEDESLVLASFTCFIPTKEEAEAKLQAIHDSRPGGAKTELFCSPTSLAAQYVNQGAANPEGHRYCVDNSYVGNDEDVSAVLEEAFTTLPNKKSFSLYFSMTPTSRRPTNMCVSMHSDHYFALYTVWEDAADDERCTNWVHDIMRKVERHSIGSYLGDSDFQTRRTMYWDEESGKKLMELRRKWDPKGRICGFLDAEDKSGVDGLKNEHEWKA